jgi:hypothetical protein
MNITRLVICIIVVFVVVSVTDILIHSVWLSPLYGATHELWRPEGEMSSGKYMGWLHAANALRAITFSLLWAGGFADRARGLSCAVKFGLVMALFAQVHTLVTYAVQPIPFEIIWKWFVAGMVQGIILGMIVFWVYKPKTPAVVAS